MAGTLTLCASRKMLSSVCCRYYCRSLQYVLGSGAHHRLGLTAEVVGSNRVRWAAGQLSNESALPRTTDPTP